MIIGCGSIGALKPEKYDSPDTTNVITWAHALYNNPKTKESIIFIDKDCNKAKKAKNKWNGKSYWSDIRQGMYNYSPNIIVVAANTENHFQVIETILKTIQYGAKKPDILIVEKPFCNTYDEANHISAYLERAGIPTIVNYTRRFDPKVMYLKNLLNTKEFLNPENKLGIEHCRVIYTRGLKREACHAIDLMRFLFGEFVEGRILNPRYSLDDYSEKDRTYACYLSFEKCPHVFFTPTDGREMSVFEIDIFGKQYRYTFINHGTILSSFSKIDEPVYGNYSTISPISIRKEETGLTKSLEYALTNAIDYIEKTPNLEGEEETKLFCTNYDAIKVHSILEDLYKTI
jgi:predicted dehydrogenase